MVHRAQIDSGCHARRQVGHDIRRRPCTSIFRCPFLRLAHCTSPFPFATSYRPNTPYNPFPRREFSPTYQPTPAQLDSDATINPGSSKQSPRPLPSSCNVVQRVDLLWAAPRPALLPCFFCFLSSCQIKKHGIVLEKRTEHYVSDLCILLELHFPYSLTGRCPPS